jgi:DNA ligase 1
MLHKKLYKKDSKNKIRVWYVEQNIDKYRYYSGLDDGRLVSTDWTIAIPKNEGRSNSTSSEQQALLEIESEYRKKIKKGYVYDIADINKKKFQCTLAKEYVKFADKIDLSSRIWAGQIKFNGCRCILTKDGAFSRTGEKILTVPHIINEHRTFFENNPDAVLDGELFNYDLREKLNELMRIVRKTVHISYNDLEKSKEVVKYYIYDGFLNEDDANNQYVNRYDRLRHSISKLKYTVPVEYTILATDEDLNIFYSEQLVDKQEGMMLRNIESTYERKRSKNLLKYKPVDDDEAIILKIHEGNGDWNNTAKTATLLWKNKKFPATFLGSIPYLKAVFEDQHKYINNTIKFKHNGLTGLGTPNFARIDLENSDPSK